MTNIGVYIIQNKKNKKVYVGSAVNIERRWRDHKRLLRKNKHHSPHLQNSWNLDGEENFQFILIEPVKDPLHLLAVEQTFLDYYKSYESEKGYNICRIAGSPLGIKHTEETRKKMSQAKKGKNHPLYGRKHTEETKKKMREAQNAKGYCYHKSTGKYQARIKINGKQKYLGLYDTEEEARAAYLSAAEIVQQDGLQALTGGIWWDG